MADPVRLTGLRAIAHQYDAILCDVWGVLHDGLTVHPGVVEALTEFQARAPVVLITNAPRPAQPVVKQLEGLGVPRSAYSDIVSSGDVIRQHLIDNDTRAVFHIGPDRDLPLYVGTNAEVVDRLDEAEVVVAAGLRDDYTETADDYADELAAMLPLGLPFMCANPDIVVERGGELVPCAGALAQAYENIGGTVVHFGKPHAPIYQTAIARARALAPDASRILAVGDALNTDITGANTHGFDSLFITGGIHKEHLGDHADPDHEKVARFVSNAGLCVEHYTPRLVW
ncbi:MAG: TIGR01459 family HAD-type hydrolase [Pseudomonadota bacterium]